MKAFNSWYLLVVPLALLSCSEQKPAAQPLQQLETITVKTFAVAQAEGQINISSTGMLTTEREARYAFKIGGVIERVFVEEGASFKKGELLAKLKIDEIEAGYAQAKLGLEKAERDLKRVKQLHNDSVATLEQLQNTQTAYDIAKQQLESVAFNKEYAYIYASSDGFVARKLANEGEIIGGGMPVLAINEKRAEAWLLKVGLADRDWALVQPGDAVEVVLDAFPGQKLAAKVYRKSLAAEMGSGSFVVDIQVDCEGLQPAIGMFGTANIQTNVKRSYQHLPYDALIEADGQHAFVFVPLPNGKVRRQAIEIASFDNGGVQVKSGLEGVSAVVLTNSAFLNENSTINIVK